MGIFDGIMLISDMDGTLTDSRGNVSRENSEAIRYFQENGGLFTVGTGREPEHFDSFKELFVCNTYMVAMNGSVIFDVFAGKTVGRYPIKDDVKKDIVQIYENYQCGGGIVIRTEKSILYKASDESIESFLDGIESDIYVAQFIQDRTRTAELSVTVPDSFPQYKFSRGWSEGLEMFSAEAGKGTSLMRIKDMTGSKLVVAAGNYDNDIEMIQMADIGVCVSNSSEPLKKAADIITVSCDESAIALIISELKKDHPFGLTGLGGV